MSEYPVTISIVRGQQDATGTPLDQVEPGSIHPAALYWLQRHPAMADDDVRVLVNSEGQGCGVAVVDEIEAIDYPGIVPVDEQNDWGSLDDSAHLDELVAAMLTLPIRSTQGDDVSDIVREYGQLNVQEMETAARHYPGGLSAYLKSGRRL